MLPPSPCQFPSPNRLFIEPTKSSERPPMLTAGKLLMRTASDPTMMSGMTETNPSRMATKCLWDPIRPAISINLFMNKPPS